MLTRTTCRARRRGVNLRCALALVLVFGAASASAAPAGTLLVTRAHPASGLTAPGLERALLRAGDALGWALRTERVPPRVAPRVEACGPGIEATGGVLTAAIEGRETLELEWRAPSGCLAASLTAAWRREAPGASAKAALEALGGALEARAPPSAAAPASTSGAPSPGRLATPTDDPAAAARAAARRALEGVEPCLAKAVRARLDLRYRKDATGEDGYIDGPHFARDVYRDAFGLDLGVDLNKLLTIGPAVEFAKSAPARALRPGDLLFYTSYAGLPRSVMVYLGAGKMAQAARVRGVVVDDVPSSVPNYLYLVAVRPPR